MAGTAQVCRHAAGRSSLRAPGPPIFSHTAWPRNARMTAMVQHEVELRRTMQ